MEALAKECMICSNDFDEVNFPMLIPCGHSLCQVCLEKLFKLSTKPQCPYCRFQLNPMQKVIPNLELLNVLTLSENSSVFLDKKVLKGELKDLLEKERTLDSKYYQTLQTNIKTIRSFKKPLHQIQKQVDKLEKCLTLHFAQIMLQVNKNYAVQKNHFQNLFSEREALIWKFDYIKNQKSEWKKLFTQRKSYESTKLSYLEPSISQAEISEIANKFSKILQKLLGKVPTEQVLMFFPCFDSQIEGLKGPFVDIEYAKVTKKFWPPKEFPPICWVDQSGNWYSKTGIPINPSTNIIELDCFLKYWKHIM